MKGQFFILGAVLLASLFFIGLPMTGYVVKPISGDFEYLSGNIAAEFPRALNLALKAGSTESLGCFSTFLENQVGQKNAYFKSLWVVAEGSGGNVNVTVGNYLKRDITIVLNISNVIEMIYMPSGTMDSVTFTGVSSPFVFRVISPESDREMVLQRDKANLYAFFSISRGEDMLRKEVVA
jgi:hypothetical protein